MSISIQPFFDLQELNRKAEFFMSGAEGQHYVAILEATIYIVSAASSFVIPLNSFN